MRILSWDVGIEHLAYCVIEKKDDVCNIKNWELINIMPENEFTNLKCCGEKKQKKEINQ